MITVRNLSRRFGPTLAIDDLSFHLSRGEVVGFLGPNGAGKTTTMRILAGYLPATSGSAEIDGLDVLRQSLEVRKRIGYLPESVPLYREHRVLEMLRFQARLHGLPRAAARRRIPEVLDQVGIADRARSLIGHLSRGQRQRVGLAVALLHEPEVLILDEPTSGLDPLQRLEMRALLRGLAEKHTVLLSSHILPEVEAIAPRVIILSRGRIAADGTQEELVRRLGGASAVRLEAVLGPDVAAAIRLLRSMRGVRDVVDEGRLGIHHRLRIPCDEDLREDVGALAAQRGWALRELTFDRPTLEQIFARIALELEPGSAPRGDSASRPSGAPQGDLLAVVQPMAASAPPPRRAVYNLNPFEQPGASASRDLAKPLEAPRATPPAPEPPGPPEPRVEGERGA